MKPYQYVVLRCVPRVEREEFVNVGVVLYCQAQEFLDVGWHVDRARLGALDPDLDIDAVCDAMDFVEAVCRADEAAGSVAQGPRHPVRFPARTAEHRRTTQCGARRADGRPGGRAGAAAGSAGAVARRGSRDATTTLSDGT